MTEAPKKPTRKDLERWHELEEQRLELDRQKKALEALQAPIEEHCLAYVRHAAPKERVVVLYGFRLLIALHKKAVQWKNEFVRVLGDAGHAEAEKLVAAAGTREVLKIEAAK